MTLFWGTVPLFRHIQSRVRHFQITKVARIAAPNAWVNHQHCGVNNENGMGKKKSVTIGSGGPDAFRDVGLPQDVRRIGRVWRRGKSRCSCHRACAGK